MADSLPVRVLGVLAGADMPVEQLRGWVESSQVVLAADGGADRLLAIGVVPKATVGDLDSITEEASLAQTSLLRDEDQDSTDCDKLLAHARSLGHLSLTLVGVEGDLLDHVIGTVQSVARSGMDVRLALRRGIGLFLSSGGSLEIPTLQGGRLSVIPLDRCEGVTLKGTRWVLEDAVLDPFGLTSLSNIAEGPSAAVSVRRGHLFVFVETDGLPHWGEP